jgi:hypothetical protein
MVRPVTLFTGQWADLTLDTLWGPVKPSAGVFSLTQPNFGRDAAVAVGVALATYIVPNGPPVHSKTQFQQFPSDAFRSPAPILNRHPFDQRNRLFG